MKPLDIVAKHFKENDEMGSEMYRHDCGGAGDRAAFRQHRSFNFKSFFPKKIPGSFFTGGDTTSILAQLYGLCGCNFTIMMTVQLLLRSKTDG